MSFYPFVCWWVWSCQDLRWYKGMNTFSLMCMHAKSLQSCLILCNPVDCSPPASSVQLILQARILEWIAISYSRQSSWPMDQICSSCGSCITGRFFTAESQGKPKTILEMLNLIIVFNDILFIFLSEKLI